MTPTTFERYCDQARSFLRSPIGLCLLPLLLVLAKISASPGADPDLFARVAMGRLIEINGAVPLSDPFAFTPKNQAWIDHEWLSGVVFWWIAKNVGDPGLIAFQLSMLTLSCLVLARAMWLRAPNAAGLGIWLALCLLEASFAWASTVRCQVFTYLFLPLLYLGFLEYDLQNRSRYLLLMPMVFLVWANVHGGFALGLIVLALFVATQMVRRRRALLPAFVLVGSIAVTALNPYGFHTYWGYILNALAMERPGISEWLPLYSDPFGSVTAGIFLSIVCVGFILRRSVHDILGLSLLAFSTYCAFRHTRLEAFMMVTFAVWGAPYMGEVVQRLGEKFPATSLALSRAAAFSLCLLLGLAGISLSMRLVSLPETTLDVSQYPVQACQWLKDTQPKGSRVLVGFNEGSFALWHLYPHALVSMDGRYEEVYPAKTYALNASAYDLGTEHSQDALEILDPTHILVRQDQLRKDMPRSSHLDTSWEELYRDPTFVVIGRRDFIRSDRRTSLRGELLWEPGF